MSGGTALNSVANQRCFEQSPFTNLYLHPACGDDGTAIGAALMMWHHMLQQPKRPRSNREAMYSRRSYDAQIPDVLRANKARLEISTPTDVVRETARAVADGQVIGWFQGASEIGPRALGNRSIVADPRSPRIKDYLNSRVKQREGFRPFAPSVLVDHARAWFGTFDSPFMLRVGPVRNGALPGITHVDGTARFQTVCNQDNPRYHELIHRFFEITGVPAVLNTSFNGKNEPIVETPQDAIDCLFSAKLDAVAFPGFLVRPRSV
jgi:carbamoyltransferase